MVLSRLIEEEIKSVLENYRTVAVLGVSRNTSKDSYQVAKYLQSVGYRVIPVNPFVEEVLGEKSYKSLLYVPEAIEVVEVAVLILRMGRYGVDA